MSPLHGYGPEPITDARLFSVISEHELLAIDAAGVAAHCNMHRLAEDCRRRASYGGLGGEPGTNVYWPRDNDPED